MPFYLARLLDFPETFPVKTLKTLLLQLRETTDFIFMLAFSFTYFFGDFFLEKERIRI